MVCTTCNGTGLIGHCHGEGKGIIMEKDANEKMKEFLNKLDKKDMVNSPKHYTFGKIEVITVIDDWGLGFYEGQVIKYIGRAKHKGNELEDLKKAQWYLNRLISQKEK